MTKVVGKVVLVLIIVAAAAVVLGMKRQEGAAQTAHAGAGEGASDDAAAPRLLEFGGPCPTCKDMKQVLASLEEHYPGQVRIEFVNYWNDVETSDRYGVRQVPTQVFLAPSGRVLWRNEGMIDEEAIAAKWAELGYPLRPAAEAAEASAAPVRVRLFAAAQGFLQGAPAVALGAALLWGALSVLLSPCHLASIPLLMAFIGKQGQATRRRGFVTSLCFALGLLVTFGLAGALAAGLGRLLHDVGAWLNYAVAALFFLVALHLWGVVPLPWSGPGQVGMKRRGLAAAFLLGLVFGIAIGPCTLVYLAPVLAASFAVGRTALAFGIVLLVAYGVGHGAVIVAAGTSTGLVQRYLNWNEESRGATIAKAACGALVAAGGLFLLYTAG